MALPTTRQQFRDLILRQLGAPVIQLELDNEQVEDNIDLALEYYHDYHYDGTERFYYKHQVTQQDIDNEYVSLPETIRSVVRILPINGSLYSTNMFSVRYQLALNDFFNVASGSYVNYYLSMVRIRELEDFFSTQPTIRFNRHTDRVYLEGITWARDVAVGNYLVFEVYKNLDPNEYSDIWADRWLIRYATALVKKQWGGHLKKFNISVLEGVTFNGDKIYDEAVEEIRLLESEMIKSYSIPVFDFIG